ncbi:MAG TPA: (d)CMP kinase, partial [Polyangiaceae bacterium]|nr:(d)CMP kinase [Polyangiaceae bacterium]
SLLAQFLDQPCEVSPYAPASRLFWNELYLLDGHGAPVDRATGADLFASLEETLEAVKRRDHQDETRAIAPLRRADDAVLVDSSELEFDGVVAHMLATVRARWPGA